MSMAFVVPAFSHQAQSWHTINWYSVELQVRELQVRIAKATKQQQWRRVKTLQRMLVRSFAAKCLAVKRVTENRGKRTAGVDRELWSTPDGKWQAKLFVLDQFGKVIHKTNAEFESIVAFEYGGNKYNVSIPEMP